MTQKQPLDLVKLLDTIARAQRATRRAYEFTPNSYTWAAYSACLDAFRAVERSLATDEILASPASGATEATQPERQMANARPGD